MTTHHEATRPSTVRRAVTAALTAGVLVVTAGYAANASGAVSRVMSMRGGALLGLVLGPNTLDRAQMEAVTRLDDLSDVTVHTAIAATPLDQRVINVAMVHAVRRNRGMSEQTWLNALARLGWRDTVSIQNMLYASAQTGDLTRILDLGDALMRRQQLTDQMIPILMAVEGDTRLRARLVNRLVDQPGWRPVYLTATGLLQTQAQLLARFDTIRQLQRRGVSLPIGDVVPSIIALDRAKMPGYAFTLWKSVRPAATSPLDDTGFILASHSYDDDRDPVPYQWQMMTGQGFSADAAGDGGRAALNIDWDGRGVPVFAQQRTSASPGRYALTLKVAPEDIKDLSALAFRLKCGMEAIELHTDPHVPTRFVTERVVPCGYPTIEITGEIQPSPIAHQLAIQAIKLTALNRVG